MCVETYLKMASKRLYFKIQSKVSLPSFLQMISSGRYSRSELTESRNLEGVVNSTL